MRRGRPITPKIMCGDTERGRGEEEEAGIANKQEATSDTRSSDAAKSSHAAFGSGRTSAVDEPPLHPNTRCATLRTSIFKGLRANSLASIARTSAPPRPSRQGPWEESHFLLLDGSNGISSFEAPSLYIAGPSARNPRSSSIASRATAPRRALLLTPGLLALGKVRTSGAKELVAEGIFGERFEQCASTITVPDGWKTRPGQKPKQDKYLLYTGELRCTATVPRRLARTWSAYCDYGATGWSSNPCLN